MAMVSIPNLEKPKNVKDAVIAALSQEWPLSAKKIYNRVMKNYNLSVSYQAVHKAIKQMTEESCVIKTGKEYSLSLEWLKRAKEQYKELEAKIENNKHLSNEELYKEEVTKLEFDNLYDCLSKLLEFSAAIAAVPHYKTKERITPVVGKFYHMYWILAATKKQDDHLRFIMERSPESHFICRGDTHADKLLAKYFGQQGAKVKTGVECASSCDVLAGGGFVIQIFFTEDFKRDLDRLYDNFGKISKSNIIELNNSLHRKKTKIQVIIIKDYELEKKIFEEVEKHFK